jgi:DNA polymerase-1
MIEFNPGSSQHISTLLFGGVLRDTIVVPCVDETGCPVVFKSGVNKGQIKTKKEDILVQIKGLEVKPSSEWKSKKDNVYLTNESVLKEIINTKEKKISPDQGNGGQSMTKEEAIKHELWCLENSIIIPAPSDEAKEVCKTMLRIRELEKQLQTYYTGTEELIYDRDSCVRPSYTHCATSTGRLACSKPNMQNVPTDYSNVKEHFSSRFEDGLIVSADYSQLEIRIQAQLCKDENYIQDILNGVDFHSKRVALKEGRSYEEIREEIEAGNSNTIHARSSAKAFSFARAYGAGTKKISMQTGLTEEEVAVLIENEEKEYPKLKLFNDWNKSVVEKQGWYKDPWGKRYSFSKYPAPGWLQQRGVKEAYSPTECLNFMIQGHATGCVVLVMLGKFWREKAIHNRDKYLLINTVHDSVMLDCKKEYVDEAKKDLTILEEVGKISLERFNYKYVVPITIDVKHGKSWLEC